MSRQALLSISPYRVFPPISVGGSRIFYLNRALTKALEKQLLVSGVADVFEFYVWKLFSIALFFLGDLKIFHLLMRCERS